MISRLGLLLSRIFQRTAPDPFVIAVLLTALTVMLALIYGEFEVADDQSRLGALIDAWRSDSTGLWRFLAFGMQMCLILVTGHALASSRPVQWLIDTLATMPKSTGGAALLVSLVACLAGLVNWGLGLIVGALLAREVGRSLALRGIRAHYPLLAAAGYSTMMLWHGGLSGSAPLTMTTRDNALKVLNPELVEEVSIHRAHGLQPMGLDDPTAPDTATATTLIPLTETIGSPLNLVITGGLLIIVPILLMMMAPKREQDMQPITDYAPIEDATSKAHGFQSVGFDDADQSDSIPEKLNRSRILAWGLGIALLAAIWRFAGEAGLADLGLNQINATMLAFGLILHGSPKAYMDAVTDGARGCAGIIIQFPLYGGIMGIMTSAGLVTKLAEWFIKHGNETTIPVMSFLAAGIVNLFVPSGGGQWAIQGPVALEAGLASGIEPGRMVMAVAFGDQLTNMLQPFWALPLLAITGVKARDIVGYTCLVMMAGMLWMMLGLLVF
jgi:short-chain fatty acids transporter